MRILTLHAVRGVAAWSIDHGPPNVVPLHLSARSASYWRACLDALDEAVQCLGAGPYRVETRSAFLCRLLRGKAGREAHEAVAVTCCIEGPDPSIDAAGVLLRRMLRDANKLALHRRALMRLVKEGDEQ